MNTTHSPSSVMNLMMFPGLMSRWTIPCSLKCFIPAAKCNRTRTKDQK